MTNQGRDFRSSPCGFCGGVHLGTQPGRCVYQCPNCGEDTRPPRPLVDGETWQHKCDTPRTQDEIEEKKYEQLLNEPPHLLARPDPGDVCACGDRRIEHGEPPNDGPCRLNGLGHSGAPPCNSFRPDELHDAEGRPISLAAETADNAKLSAFIEGTRREPRCSFCGQPEWHKDHHGQIHNADMRNHIFQSADTANRPSRLENENE